MGSGLSAFDDRFLRGLNISTDGIESRRSSQGSIPHFQPSEIVTYWEDLSCHKTLKEIAVLTDLIRAVTVRLINAAFQSDYADVLRDIDFQLKDVLRRYPGSEGSLKNEDDHNFRLCNIALLPATDEGIAFVRSVYGLLKGRQDELEEEKKRLEDEKNALLPKDPLPLGNVFLVKIQHVRAKRRGFYLVWAKNETAATERALVKFHHEFPKVRAENWPFKIVYVHAALRGSDCWNSYFERGGKCE
jgi:hypothetical protein